MNRKEYNDLLEFIESQNSDRNEFTFFMLNNAEIRGKKLVPWKIGETKYFCRSAPNVLQLSEITRFSLTLFSADNFLKEITEEAVKTADKKIDFSRFSFQITASVMLNVLDVSALMQRQTEVSFSDYETSRGDLVKEFVSRTVIGSSAVYGFSIPGDSIKF